MAHHHHLLPCPAAGAAKLQGKTFPGAADSDDDGELPELNSDDIVGEVDSGEAQADAWLTGRGSRC